MKSAILSVLPPLSLLLLLLLLLAGKGLHLASLDASDEEWSLQTFIQTFMLLSTCTARCAIFKMIQ